MERKLSEESREKMRKSHKGRYPSLETRLKMSKAGREYFIDKEILIKLYSNDHLSMENIAKKFNASITVIRDRLIEYDIPIRSPIKLTEEEKKNIRKKYYEIHYFNNKEYIKEYGKQYRLRKKKMFLGLFGDKCKICGSTEKLVFHEKFGIEHRHNYKYFLENKDNFITLCAGCHDVLHKYRYIKCPKFDELLKLLEKQK